MPNLNTDQDLTRAYSNYRNAVDARSTNLTFGGWLNSNGYSGNFTYKDTDAQIFENIQRSFSGGSNFGASGRSGVTRHNFVQSNRDQDEAAWSGSFSTFVIIIVVFVVACFLHSL